MTEDISRIVQLFQLEGLDGDAFVGPVSQMGPPRLYGGLVAAQSLRAACSTVRAEYRPHSLHGYFVLPGKTGEPVRYEVDRSRDGRSFVTRHVSAKQDGKVIFELMASFHATEDGDDWQPPAPTGVPRPDDLQPLNLPPFMALTRSFDLRTVTAPTGPFPLAFPFWIKAIGALDDDPVLHVCLLTFLSDFAIMGASRPAGGSGIVMGASLDHTMWFHRPVRVDEWLLYSAEPVSTQSARGLARGSLHSADGRLVCTVMQEALLRVNLPR